MCIRDRFTVLDLAAQVKADILAADQLLHILLAGMENILSLIHICAKCIVLILTQKIKTFFAILY